MATWPPLGADTTTSPEEEEWSWTEPPHPASPPATAPAKTLLTTCTLACVQGGKIITIFFIQLFGGHAPYTFYIAIFMWYHGNLTKYQACGDASSPQWTDVPGTFLLSASRLYINQLNTGLEPSDELFVHRQIYETDCKIMLHFRHISEVLKEVTN